MDSRYGLGDWVPNCGVSPKELNKLYSRIDKQQFYSGYKTITFPYSNGNINRIFKNTDGLYMPNSQDIENHYDDIFSRIGLQLKGPDPCFNLYKDLKSLEYKFRCRNGIPRDYLFHRDHYRGKTMTQRQHDCSKNFNTRYDYDHNFYQAYRFGMHENKV